MDADNLKNILYILSMTELKYCKQCDMDKPIDNFYHYHRKGWAEGRVWIHTICLSCENKNNKARSKRNYVHKLRQQSPKQILKQKERDLEFLKSQELKLEQEKYRTCIHCGEELELNSENFYYVHRIKNYETACRICRKETAKKWRYKNIGRGEEELCLNPGEYAGEEERLAVEEILKICGWLFYEKNKIWYKMPLKSKHNNWKYGRQKNNQRKETKR